MKKLFKLFSVLVIMLGVVFMLSGCGDEDEGTSSKKKKNTSEENVTNTVETNTINETNTTNNGSNTSNNGSNTTNNGSNTTNNGSNTTGTGIGDINTSGSNKLVGEMEEDGTKSKIEMTFDNNDKLDTLKLTFVYSTKAEADAFYEESKEEIKGTTIQLVQQGNEVGIVFNAQNFASKFGISADALDKATMKEFAKYMGYTLK